MIFKPMQQISSLDIHYEMVLGLCHITPLRRIVSGYGLVSLGNT